MAKKKAAEAQNNSAEKKATDKKTEQTEETTVTSETELTSTDEFAVVSEESEVVASEGASADNAACAVSDPVYEEEGASVEKLSIMTLLRSARLNALEIYRVSERFFEESIDISALLMSMEENLVVNTLEVLSRCSYWHSDAVRLIATQNEEISAKARSYVLEFISAEASIAHCVVDALVELRSSHAENAEYQAYVNRVLSAFLVRMSRADDAVNDWLQPFSKLLSCVEKRRVERMLYDPSALVRVGVLRYMTTLDSIEIYTLASILILLKDNNEQINEAVLRLVAHFACYPEIAVSPLIAYIARQGMHKQLVFDAFRRFSNDASAPLLAALGEQSDETASAVKTIILASPHRYIDALKEGYSSCRTRPPAKVRIEDILKAAVDVVEPPMGAEILEFLAPPAPVKPAEPEQLPKSKPADLIDPVLSNDDAFYAQVLDDAALAAYTHIETEAVARLLNDSRECPRINALHLIRIAKQKDNSLKSSIFVWLKSYNEEIAKAAFDAYVSFYESETVELTQKIIDVIGICENRKMAAFFFDYLAQHQAHTNNIMTIYRGAPERYKALVVRCLKSNPSAETINAVGKCLSNDVAPGCIATTLQLLDKNSLANFNYEPYRKRLLEIIDNPPSTGEYGTAMRRHALHILNNLVKEGDHDRNTIETLKSAYKRFYYPDFKKITTEILQKMDEDSFDDLEDDDDFDDLDED